MTPRITTTAQAAERLGMLDRDGKPNSRAFLSLSKADGFPKPIVARGHHKLWDFNAIERWLDSRGGIVKESPNWKSKFIEAMTDGANNRALSH